MKLISGYSSSLFTIFVILVGCGNSSGGSEVPPENDIVVPLSDQVATHEASLSENQSSSNNFPQNWVLNDMEWVVSQDLGKLRATLINDKVLIKRDNSNWLALDCDHINKMFTQTLKTITEKCSSISAKNPTACQFAASGMYGIIKAPVYVTRPTYPFDVVSWNQDTWSMDFTLPKYENVRADLAKKFATSESEIFIDTAIPSVSNWQDSSVSLIFTDTQRERDFEKLQFLLDHFGKDEEKFQVNEAFFESDQLVTTNRLLSCEVISGGLQFNVTGGYVINQTLGETDLNFHFYSN